MARVAGGVIHGLFGQINLPALVTRNAEPGRPKDLSGVPPRARSARRRSVRFVQRWRGEGVCISPEVLICRLSEVPKGPGGSWDAWKSD